MKRRQKTYAKFGRRYGFKAPPRKSLSRKDKTSYQKPSLDPSLKPILRKIGVPASEIFVPDPFQLEALELIQDYDVLVSAPTGAGKTWIAIQAIHSYLSDGLRVWYGSPLKALSNSIYREFCHEFGPELCGILTGDRKENPEASVIVGTTEILRNQLYDAMHEGTSIRAALVILDEAHYLADPERGVVWEEVLIYLPSRVRLLLLSATISNAKEVCAWLSKIREVPNRIIYSERRPVPVEMLFLFPSGRIAPLGGKKGLHPRIKKFLRSYGEIRSPESKRIHFGELIRVLRRFALLPAIFFLKSRMDCDRALWTCPPVEIRPVVREAFKKEVEAFLQDYPHLKNHRQMRPLMKSLVGAHHGGQLPYWKLLIEKMMNRGHLDAIFSTSTVAAGVNFPARTVVLVQSDRYNGKEFIDLTATELHQMVGRAGRRGKDHIGFAMIIPGPHQNPHLLYKLKDSAPEPLQSHIHVNFSMTLNLLLSHTPEETKRLLERSFAAFQERERKFPEKAGWDKMLSDLKKMVPNGKCEPADPYEVLENIQERAELCEGCESVKLCRATRKSELRRLLNRFRTLTGNVDSMSGGLWLSFKRHLRFLKETGFVDPSNHLTSDGYWASKLRLDQPLLIAEAIRGKVFETVSPELLAGGLAPFVWDKVQELELRVSSGIDLTDLESLYGRILERIENMKVFKSRRGFGAPQIVFWPSVALYLWAKGVTWRDLVSTLSADEGDVVSLIMRTADHLRQVTNLTETHAELASVAERAITLILREPVYIP